MDNIYLVYLFGSERIECDNEADKKKMLIKLRKVHKARGFITIKEKQYDMSHVLWVDPDWSGGLDF